MTDSTENATHSKYTKSRNSNFLVQYQTKPKSQFEFVPQNTDESEFLDLVDFGGIVFSVETVICNQKSPCLPKISPSRRATLATVFAVESKTEGWR